jgi:tRNA pseudouridine38-40 synthase
MREGQTFRFTIRANAFLYHMVRRIVYALILVGRENGEPSRIERILEHPDENSVQGLAPAEGLVLDRVLYSLDLGTEFER